MSSVTTSTTLPTNTTSLHSVPKLAFGVEIEIFVKPRPNLEGTKFRACLTEYGWSDYVVSSPSLDQSEVGSRQNRNALRFAIAEALTQGGLEAWTTESCPQEDPYKKWTVVHEGLAEPSTFWGIELVSPVLHTEHDWQAKIDKMFDILETYCEVKTTHACGTHVHVSPGRDRRYTDEQLRAVSKGLTYFEQPLVAVLPGNGKENGYCRSNILHPEFEGETEIQLAWKAIPTTSWAPVLDILEKVNYETVSSILGGMSKCSAWNLSRCAYEAGSGTLECRRPPGVESAQQVKHWAGLVLGLFAQSMAIDWSTEYERLKTRHDHPSVDELECFVSRGLELLGTTCQNALVKEWMVEDVSKEWRDKGLGGGDPFYMCDRQGWMKRRSGDTTNSAGPQFQVPADPSWQYRGWDGEEDSETPNPTGVAGTVLFDWEVTPGLHYRNIRGPSYRGDM